MIRLIRALIDTAALRHNLGTIRAYAPGANAFYELMEEWRDAGEFQGLQFSGDVEGENLVDKIKPAFSDEA